MILFAGAAICLGLVLAGWRIASSIDRLADRLDRINTHGLHLRNYPEKPFVVKSDV